MAQGIQVPQTTPNAPQFQVPTDLVNAYLQRKQNEQKMFLGATEDLGNAVNTMHQQKIQNQLAALGAISNLYAAGGPRAVQTYGAGVNQMSGSQMVPPTPQQTIPPQGTPGNATLPTVRDQSPSPYIQASLGMGHPDIAGVGSFHTPQTATAGTPNTMGQSQSWNAPQPSQADLEDIQSGGTYGRNKAQSFMDLGNMAMQPITAQQKQLDMQKTTGELGMQPTEAALKSQQLINAQQEIPQKQKATIAGEVSKESQSTQNITQLKTLSDNLQNAMQGKNSGIFGNQAGNLYQATGGRIGSKTAASIQNAANPLATALNTELSRRFNSGEVALLTQSLIPQPKDTPQYAQQKLQNLNKLIDSMASGNETNVKNVAAAITSGAIPTIGKSSPVQVPNGRITVVSPTGQIGHIPQAQLAQALKAGYKQQ